MRQTVSPSGEGMRALTLVVSLPALEARAPRDYVVIGSRHRRQHRSQQTEKEILEQLPWYAKAVVPGLDATALLQTLNQWDFSQVEKSMRAQNLALQRAAAALQLVQSSITVEDDIVSDDMRRQFSEMLWREVRAKMGGSFHAADISLVSALREIVDYLSASESAPAGGSESTGQAADDQVYEYINSFVADEYDSPPTKMQVVEHKKQVAAQTATQLAASYGQILERHVFRNGSSSYVLPGFGGVAPVTLPSPSAALLSSSDSAQSDYPIFNAPMFGNGVTSLVGTNSPDALRQKWMDQVRLAVCMDAGDQQQLIMMLSQMRDSLTKAETAAKRRIRCIKQLMLLCTTVREVLNNTTFWARQAPAYRWMRACVATRVNEYMRTQTTNGAYLTTALQGELVAPQTRIDYEYLRWLDAAKRHSPTGYRALLSKWNEAPYQAPVVCCSWEDRTRIILVSEERLKLVNKPVQRGDSPSKISPIVLTEEELEAIRERRPYSATPSPPRAGGLRRSSIKPAQVEGDLVFSISELTKRYEAQKKAEKRSWLRRKLHL